MRGQSRSGSSEPIEFKGTTLPLVSALLQSVDPALLAATLEQRLGHLPDFFSGEAVLLDISAIQPPPAQVDWSALMALLSRYQLVPVAARASGAPADSARAAGLAVVEGTEVVRTPPPSPAPEEAEAVPAPEAATPEPAQAPVPSAAAEPRSTMVVDKPLRSGQQVYAKGSDLVVLAMVSVGAEVIADGSIHVYAPLRGRALAGARGDPDARIFTTSFEAELVSINGVYRTFEQGIPSELARKPAQVRLSTQGERQSLSVEALKIA